MQKSDMDQDAAIPLIKCRVAAAHAAHEANREEADGWKYGPVKDPEKKEHPCFVPYDDLPPSRAEGQGRDLRRSRLGRAACGRAPAFRGLP